MKIDELKPGVIVRGPILPEPVEVMTVTPLGDALKLVGMGKRSGRVHQRVLHADQIKLLEGTPEREPFDGDPVRFRLGVEATRLGLAYEHDPYFSLSVARVDPLPHQLEAVYDYFLKLPRIRFLLPLPPNSRAWCLQSNIFDNPAMKLLGDFAAKAPRLHLVQDPAGLAWESVVRVAHYHVGPEKIVAAGESWQ